MFGGSPYKRSERLRIEDCCEVYTCAAPHQRLLLRIYRAPLSNKAREDIQRVRHHATDGLLTIFDEHTTAEEHIFALLRPSNPEDIGHLFRSLREARGHNQILEALQVAAQTLLMATRTAILPSQSPFPHTISALVKNHPGPLRIPNASYAPILGRDPFVLAHPNLSMLAASWDEEYTLYLERDASLPPFHQRDERVVQELLQCARDAQAESAPPPTFHALDSMVGMVRISYPERKVISANTHSQELLEYPDFETMRREFSPNKHYASAQTRAAFLKSFQHQTPFPVELKILTRNGAPLWILSKNRLSPSQKELEMVFLDITALKESEEQIARLESQLQHIQKIETIGTLAGGIAHDFNNMLTPILSCSTLAMTEVPQENPVWEDLHQITIAAKRAKDLVQQILAFSRLQEPVLQKTSLQETLRNVIKLVRSSLPADIDLHLNLDPECPIVFADATQIHQVVLNLCTNAHHAMLQNKGAIEVSLQSADLQNASLLSQQPLQGDWVHIQVHDNGQGIPQEHQTRIFEPFFTTKEVGKGTGLGLSVVHGIVTSHQGHIALRSAPNQGTTFHVFLPAHTDNGASPPPQLHTVPGQGERILLIDDDEQITSTATRLLQRLNYNVDAFTRCREALHAFSQTPHKWQLVLTDQTMPEMDGVSLARHIHQIRPDLPIVLFSGHGVNKDQNDSLPDSVAARLMKPFTSATLSTTIRRILHPEE